MISSPTNSGLYIIKNRKQRCVMTFAFGYFTATSAARTLSPFAFSRSTVFDPRPLPSEPSFGFMGFASANDCVSFVPQKSWKTRRMDDRAYRDRPFDYVFREGNADSNPVTPTKKGKGERELSLSLFDRSDGEENLLRACGTAIDLDTASIKLDTIGSSAQALRVFDRFRVLSLRPNLINSNVRDSKRIANGWVCRISGKYQKKCIYLMQFFAFRGMIM